jgi:hypothetical protein
MRIGLICRPEALIPLLVAHEARTGYTVTEITMNAGEFADLRKFGRDVLDVVDYKDIREVDWNACTRAKQCDWLLHQSQHYGWTYGGNRSVSIYTTRYISPQEIVWGHKVDLLGLGSPDGPDDIIDIIEILP